MPEVFPVLIGVSVIGPLPETVTDPALMVPVITLVHVKFVPAMLAVGAKLSGKPLQICCENDAAELVRTGIGLTVTVTGTATPAQPFALGIML